MDVESVIEKAVPDPEQQDEILALWAIFEELGFSDDFEINVEGGIVVSLSINPSDGARVLSGQERRVSFVLSIDYSGPDKVLSAKLCRGISTKRNTELDEALIPQDDCETIFDIIERVKDLLYEWNERPDGECPISLMPLKDSPALYKAEACFHLFDAESFAMFVFETLSRLKEENARLPDDKKLPEIICCPVCRAELDISPGEFRKYRPKSKKPEKVVKPAKPDYYAKIAIERQKAFQKSFAKQVENDGHFSETVNCLYVPVTTSTVETVPETVVEEPKPEPEEPKEEKNHRNRGNRGRNRGHYRPRGSRGKVARDSPTVENGAETNKSHHGERRRGNYRGRGGGGGKRGQNKLTVQD